jgi:hypothetical protein
VRRRIRDMSESVSITNEQLQRAIEGESVVIVPAKVAQEILLTDHDGLLAAEYVPTDTRSQKTVIEDVDEYEIVVTKIQSHCLYFEVYKVIGSEASGKRVYNREGYQSSPDPVNDRDNAQKFIDGSIKWDGCANFTIEDEPIHFCGPDDAESFGKILPTIYRLGSDLIPSWEG